MLYKHLNLNQTEYKFGAEGSLQFEGYLSKFGGVDSYGDRIVKGAFLETLKDRERPVRLRWNHWGDVVGKFTDLHEDDIGLHVSGELTKGHSVAENVAASMRHGTIDGLSIGYIAEDHRMNGPIRELLKINLIEGSIVEDQADLGAFVTGIKSAFAECESLKEIEKVLRMQAGLSQSASTAIVSAVKKVVAYRDGGEAKEMLDILNNFKIK